MRKNYRTSVRYAPGPTQPVGTLHASLLAIQKRASSGIAQSAEHGTRKAATPVRFRIPDPFLSAQSLPAMNRFGKAARPVRFWRADPFRGIGSLAERQPSKLKNSVRFRDLAPSTRGCSSAAERKLAKLQAVGSSPTIRSNVVMWPGAGESKDSDRYSTIGNLRSRPRDRSRDTDAQISLGMWPTGKALVLQTSFSGFDSRHVHQVMLALAERLRRLPVEQSRSVQLRCVNPRCSRSSNGGAPRS